MEKNIKIKTSDDHLIYGTLVEDSPSDSLVIIVHGLTGATKDHIIFNGSHYLATGGFNTFRLELYLEQIKARRLVDCSLQTHIDDLHTVITHFKDSYKKIYLIGHSLGGTTVAKADHTNIDKIVLWDPILAVPERVLNDFEFNEALNQYTVNWRTKTILSTAMANECNSLSPAMLQKAKPTKIIGAENGYVTEGFRKFLDENNYKHEFVVIPKADHNYNSKASESALFQETLNFLK